MAAFKFNGNLTQEPDGSFAVRIELVGIPAMSDAQQIGKFLHETISDYFASRGAVLAQEPKSIIFPQ